jgi:alanine racemase
MVTPARARAVEAIRPTRAVVDLEALATNLRAIRAVAPTPEVFGVIKADAYGHGAVQVARRLAREGVDGLCVALPEEGIELRQAGLRLPVLILGGTYADGAEETLAFGLTPVVHDLEQIARLHQVARGRQVKVHLKVDTGMSRLGVSITDLPRTLWRAKRYPSVVIDGVMSHLAAADAGEEATIEQLDRFGEALKLVGEAGLQPAKIHMANSAGLFRFPSTHFDLVRPGLALYGVPAAPGCGLGLEPVMTVVTAIVHMRQLRPGDRVSYGGTFVAQRPTRLAVLPVGYADGLSPRMANQGAVLIHGCRAPVVGAVCMDMCMVDVTDIAGAEVGDEVVLLGRQGAEEITATELAAIHGSVPHEVLTSVSRRVPRFYVR